MAGATADQKKKLSDSISDVLNSNSAQRINFLFENCRISGSNYTFIALALAGGKSVSFDFDVTPGAAATYQPTNNTYSFPNANYGSAAGFERMTIVHESTHAVIDSLPEAFGHPTRLTNETTAYIAGALFNVFSGSPFDPTTGIYGEAHKLAKSIAKDIAAFNYTDCYNIIPNRAAALKSAILASPTYQGTNMSGVYGDNGLNL